MKGAIQMSNLENYMKQQAIFCEQNDSISKNLYSEYGVKRGLRDEKGQGVLTGLTNISDIKAFEYRDGVKSPCDGELSYRGTGLDGGRCGLSAGGRVLPRDARGQAAGAGTARLRALQRRAQDAPECHRQPARRGRQPR